MYKGFDLTAFLLGLPLGMFIMGVTSYIVIRKGKKERRYDERYTKIHNGARSISWYVTSGFILLSWTFVLMYEPPGLAFFVLTALWVVHMISYGMGAMMMNKRY